VLELSHRRRHSGNHEKSLAFKGGERFLISHNELRSQQGFEAIHILGKQRECRINRFRLSEVNARIFEGIMLQ